MAYDITETFSRKNLRDFLQLPFSIYRKDPCWVAPLQILMKQTLRGKDNPLFSNGPHALLVLRKSGKTIGRLVVGIDEQVNREKGVRRGYFSLFECLRDKEAAFALLDYARAWLKQRGMDIMEGPVSPTNGDDYRGLLVQGFESLPSLMNSYNPPYYQEWFEEYGFKKTRDLQAYRFLSENYPAERIEKAVSYAQSKYDFRVDTANLKQLEREIRDIRQILEQAVPEDWSYFVVPSLEDIRKTARSLLRFIDPQYVCIARKNQDNRPIGFVVGTPDYNQVLQKIRGRLFPFGIFRFFYYRRQITRVRLFIQFVVPEYQGRAVNAAIFHRFFHFSRSGHIREAEGGTVGEDNHQGSKILRSVGGTVSKIYRIYHMKL